MRLERLSVATKERLVLVAHDAHDDGAVERTDRREARGMDDARADVGTTVAVVRVARPSAVPPVVPRARVHRRAGRVAGKAERAVRARPDAESIARRAEAHAQNAGAVAIGAARGRRPRRVGARRDRSGRFDERDHPELRVRRALGRFFVSWARHRSSTREIRACERAVRERLRPIDLDRDVARLDVERSTCLDARWLAGRIRAHVPADRRRRAGVQEKRERDCASVHGKTDNVAREKFGR